MRAGLDHGSEAELGRLGQPPLAVGHGDRRLAEAEKFGLRGVIEPGAHPTLRGAVTAALGGARPDSVAA